MAANLTKELIQRVDDTLSKEISQLVELLLSNNFDVGRLVLEESAPSMGLAGAKWTLQFMGTHLRFKIVVHLKEVEADQFLIDHTLYELIGHNWEPIYLPKFDTVSTFSHSISVADLKQKAIDLELNVIPFFIKNGGYAK